MSDLQRRVDEAERWLAAALGPDGSCRESEPRRAALARAVQIAADATQTASVDDDPRGAWTSRARLVIARANAALAELARHGAGQLSLSAQRAPTVEDCELGWTRVASIVEEARGFADASRRAADAVSVAHVGSARDARRAAERASRAAIEAEALVHARNEAFTFHTDDAFSFGEGWHVAAAAVLTGAALQIEAEHRATPHVERFLRAAGVYEQIVPARPRPRAQRQSTGLVARAFASDPASAQRRLRRAWLGDEPIAAEVRAFVEARAGVEGGRARPSVALWVRRGTHQPERNTAPGELTLLVRAAIDAGLRPLLLGEAPPSESATEGAIDLTLHRVEPVFAQDDARRAQLQLFELLRSEHGLIAQLGVTSAGMDGPALLGLATAYVTAQANPRMRQWVGAVPGYEEVLRPEDEAAFERSARAVFARWASARDAQRTAVAVERG